MPSKLKLKYVVTNHCVSYTDSFNSDEITLAHPIISLNRQFLTV